MGVLLELQDTFDEKTKKKYKLGLLSRIAHRLEDFGPACPTCQGFQEDYDQLLEPLKHIYLDAMGMSDFETKRYHDRVKRMVKHLKKEHHLVSEGYYFTMYMAIGSATGVATGSAASVSPPLAGLLPLGIVAGMLAGRYLDKKAERENRVI